MVEPKGIAAKRRAKRVAIARDPWAPLIFERSEEMVEPKGIEPSTS